MNSFKKDLLQRIYITLDVCEFLQIHLFNWCSYFLKIHVFKALYSASSITSRYLNFIRAVRWALRSFPYAVFVNKDCYVVINTWNTEFYIPLLLRENKSRYKIWHWLELGCFCKWKQSTNKEILAYGMVLAYRWHYFDFNSKAGYNEPMQELYLTFGDNKG